MYVKISTKQFVTHYDQKTIWDNFSSLCYVKGFVYSSMPLAWIVSCIYSEWYKVMYSDHLQIKLPDGGLATEKGPELFKALSTGLQQVKAPPHIMHVNLHA